GAVNLDQARQEILELQRVEVLVGAQHERLHRVVVLVIVALQERWVDLEHRVQVESADVEDLGDRRVPEVHRPHRRARVHATEPGLQPLARRVVHQVDLREQDPIGEADLLLRLLVLVELLLAVTGVDDGDDRVEQIVVGDVVVDEEGLRDRPRIGHAGGLDDDPLETDLAAIAALAQVAEDPDQVTANGAADAAVVHLDDLLVAVLEQQVVVHALLAELVLDHRDAVAVLFPEDAVEQRGLAAAEETGEDGHRNVRVGHRNPSSDRAFYGLAQWAHVPDTVTSMSSPENPVGSKARTRRASAPDSSMQ